MTVAELKELLEKYDDSAVVMLYLHGSSGQPVSVMEQDSDREHCLWLESEISWSTLTD
jgi:hypothetical protein